MESGAEAVETPVDTLYPSSYGAGVKVVLQVVADVVGPGPSSASGSRNTAGSGQESSVTVEGVDEEYPPDGASVVGLGVMMGDVPFSEFVDAELDTELAAEGIVGFAEDVGSVEDGVGSETDAPDVESGACAAPADRPGLVEGDGVGTEVDASRVDRVVYVVTVDRTAPPVSLTPTTDTTPPVVQLSDGSSEEVAVGAPDSRVTVRVTISSSSTSSSSSPGAKSGPETSGSATSTTG